MLKRPIAQLLAATCFQFYVMLTGGGAALHGLTILARPAAVVTGVDLLALAVEHLAELRAVMGGGMGHGVASDEAIFAVDADMVLVAEHRHRDLRDHPALGPVSRRVSLAAPLDGPAAIAVDLGRTGLLPGTGRTALRDGYPAWAGA